MPSQYALPTRRQFLERSMLGFGSAFVLPSLLAGCSDHLIDPTKPPLIPPISTPNPLLGDDNDIDWADDAKIVVVAGLEMIPEIGEILGPLVDILWPASQRDIWAEIKEKIEALIDQKIADDVYGRVTASLNGLRIAALDYANEVHSGTPSEILTQWIATKTVLDASLGTFQQKGDEVLLLPLFAQFANMYLALLRDGLAFGKSWGRTDADQQQLATDLATRIKSFVDYANNTYAQGRDAMVQKTQPNARFCERFRTVNKYDRQMTRTVLYFVDTWPYYDFTLYPKGAPDALSKRIIYSDPWGTCDDSGEIVIPSPAPTQRPTNVTVWGYDRVDAIQVTYPAGTGPGGATTTRGGGSGGRNQSPYGGSFDLTPDSPIIAARVHGGDIINELWLMFDGGLISGQLGGRVDGGNINSGWLGYDYQAITVIHVNGESGAYQSADSVVFGFQYWKSPTMTQNALRAIYVRSPKERSMAAFAQALPGRALPANLITDELKAARKAYWAHMKTRK